MTQKGQIQELVGKILKGIKDAEERGLTMISFEVKNVPPWIVTKAILHSLHSLGRVAYGLLSGGLEEDYYEKIYVDLTRSRPKDDSSP